MNGPHSFPVGRATRVLLCLPIGVLVAAELARLPSAFGATLGNPIAPLGAAALVAVAAATIHAACRRPSLLGALFGSIFALAAFVCFDLDVPRRRGVALAIGAAVTIEASRMLIEHCALRGRAWVAIGSAILIALAVGGFQARAAADRAPLRGEISVSSASPRQAPPRAARSIVLITMDTTRRVDLGCYGQERATTPHIDSFAAGSTRFSRAYATSPFTAPSIASIITGQLPVDHGSISSSPLLAPGSMTLAEHCYESGFETAGFLDNPWLGTDFGLARGYEYLSRQTNLREIERWLDARQGQRFFLHVHLFHPHGPYDLRTEGLAALGGPSVPPAAREIGDSIPARRIRDGEVPGRSGLSPEEMRWAHDIYLSEVRAMDDWIGSFLGALDERDLLESSVIALTADHGEEFGERGGMHHSHTLFGELVHVPLIIRSRELVTGSREQTISLAALGPSLATLAGIEPMPGMSESIPGLNSNPANSSKPKPAISIRCRQAGRHFLRATTDRWALHVRLIPDREGEEIWLFDLAADPGESTNVLGQFENVASEILSTTGVTAALEGLRKISLVPEEGTQRVLTPRTARDLRVLGYAK